MIECGRVGRPHGRDGAFHVTRPVALLLPVRGQNVTVGGHEHTVARRGGTDQRPTLKLAEISTRPAAEALRGEGVWVERDATPLEADEWWADDLVGLAVRDGERSVGVVEAVRAYPSCELLVVGERLIPLVGDAVRTVDLEAGVIDIDLGFLGE